MTPQENFRLGFLLRCAEEGCTPDEIRERVKMAQVVLTKEASGATGLAGIVGDGLRASVSPAWNVAKTMFTLPLHATLLGMGAAGALGAGAGYGMAKFQNSDIDPEEAKRQELIAAYKLQADMARRRAQLRSYRPSAPTASKLM